ncbi:MAG: nuclear transport factor 2 family protein [Deltaproteobacteria bacterium]|nr:nuclear transport factor 2 family protein [Deltaproteobacteria bacterium]
MTTEPSSVAAEYFTRIRARDISVAELFHTDATLIGLGQKTSGRDAIRDFYQGAIDGASPTPRSIGNLLADGSRVAGEVMIDLADGQVIHAVDIFVVEEGLIRSLTYFLCDQPS